MKRRKHSSSQNRTESAGRSWSITGNNTTTDAALLLLTPLFIIATTGCTAARRRRSYCCGLAADALMDSIQFTVMRRLTDDQMVHHPSELIIFPLNLISFSTTDERNANGMDRLDCELHKCIWKYQRCTEISHSFADKSRSICVNYKSSSSRRVCTK